MTDEDELEFAGSDRYAVRRCLGGGYLGLVYEGYDRVRKVEVALKTLRASTPSSLYRLKQEFRSLADLSHPNLVTLYELVGGEDSDWFIAMELVKGVDFYRHVRGVDAPNPLSSASWVSREIRDIADDPTAQQVMVQPEASLCEDLPRLQRALIQLLSGVGALHEAGKLHRDIKPSNTLVTSEGRVVLVDFGLVYDADRAASELSRVDRVTGTLAYMAPEQVLGADPSAAGDMYSVGVLLFQGLTGRLPWDGSLTDVLEQVQAGTAPRPSALVDGVPKALDDLCAALMARDPARRPTALEALLKLGEDPSLLAVQARVRQSQQDRIEGREQERRFLENAWHASSHGRLVVATVRGESGMGKSALVYHFLRALRSEDEVTILRGRCYEREQVPYKALDSLMDGLRRRLKRLPPAEVDALLPPDAWLLARIFPVLAELVRDQEPTDRDALAIDPSELRLRAFHALRELIRNLARSRPVVVAIDDVQWGDADSARLLVGWLKSLTRSRVLLLLSWRSEDEGGSPFLQTLLHDPIWARTEVRALELGPLASAVATGIARMLLGDRHPNPIETAVWIAEESGGNPHLLSELAATLRTSAELGVAGADQSLTLDQLVRDRMAQLPDEGRRLLSFVAIAGRPLPLRVLQRAAELEAGVGPKVVSLLRTQRFVRTNEGPLGMLIEPYHGRVAHAVQDAVSPDRAGNLHARLAAAMEAERWDDPEALMLHHLNAGNLARAAELALAAARNAVDTLAFDQAAELYRTALELGSWDAATGEDIRLRLAEALTYAGRGPQAADEFLALAAEAPAPEAMALRRRAAEQLLSTGHNDRGLELLVGVLRDVGLEMPGTGVALAGSLAAQAACLWWGRLAFKETPEASVSRDDLQRIDTCWFSALALLLVDPPRGLWFHQRNTLYALRAGEPFRVLRALCMEMTVQASRDGYDWDAWNTLDQRCKALANKLGRPHAAALVHLGEGMSAYLDGKFPAAQRLLHQAERLLVELCPGTTFEVALARLFALRAALYGGNLRATIEQHQRMVADADLRGDRVLAANVRGGLFTMLYLAEGDAEGARLALRAAAHAAGKAAAPYHAGFALRGEVLLALYEGRRDDALQAARRHGAQSGGLSLDRTALAGVMLADARGHAAIGAGQAAEAVAIAGKLGRSRHRVAAPMRDVLLAGATLARGDRGTAADAYGRAAEGFDRVELQVHAHIARRRQGQALGGREGTALVQSADGWLEHEGVVDVPRFCRALMPVLHEIEPIEENAP